MVRWACLPLLQFGVYTFGRHFQFAALGNGHLLDRLILRPLGDVLDLVDDLVALKDFAEDNVLAIKPAIQSQSSIKL